MAIRDMNSDGFGNPEEKEDCPEYKGDAARYYRYVEASAPGGGKLRRHEAGTL